MALTLWVCFLIVFKKTADVLTPRLSVVLRPLVGDWLMPSQFPKGHPSSSVANYKSISITPVLSNVFNRLDLFVFEGL